jgi:Uma2 family endonuclease
MPHAQPRLLRRDEYDRMGQLGFFDGERVELIRGTVVRMWPIGPPHADLVDRLMTLFVRGLGDRARVRIQQPFLAVDESEPEPDVAIVPSRSYAEEHPREAFLVIEVAESSLAYDRETKAPLYAQSGVPEYWIIDVVAHAVEVFDRLADGVYRRSRRIERGGRLHAAAFPDLVLSVADLVG